VLELPLTDQADPVDGGAALRAAAAGIDGYAWVVLTSVNAVERLVAALDDPAALARTRVAVVGPASADAVRRAGVAPDLVSPRQNAAGLVEAFAPAAPGANRRVLFPAADLAPPTVVEGLAAKGWQVERVEAYRTVALPSPDQGRSAQVANADAVVFLAASSVRAFAAGASGSGAAPPPTPALVVCIGASTAAAARAAGLPGVQEAAAPTADGLVAALVEHLGGPSGGGS
jgi:uroporphyrinogen-III synthase